VADRRLRILVALLATAFVVSVVHYADNYVNFTDYPQPEADSSLPAPGRTLIGLSWFLFTGLGVAGLWLYLRRRIVPAAFALAAYSVSGLIGIGHYLVPGATHMVWWRQAHVLADIVCGTLIAAYAVWLVARADMRQPA